MDQGGFNGEESQSQSPRLKSKESNLDLSRGSKFAHSNSQLSNKDIEQEEPLSLDEIIE
jgi:hypothetical protein